MFQPPTDRGYEVVVRSGPRGHADSDTYWYKTLTEARKRVTMEANESGFRWARITNLATGEPVE